jgi:two-component system phosphate regulon sensor histidine kinase PhoR
MVEADGVKLKQVFLNLVDNSIKYTKEGFVKISLTKNDTEKKVTFTVSDSGVGLSEETKKKLFTKFGRGEGATLNAGGSGLGLYLAQEIVGAHHGEIIVNSDGVDKGASFSVVLPYIQ